MQRPKVSIIMPTYKKLNYFKTALTTLFRSTYRNYEIIITDDSPDDTILNYVKTLKRPNIQYFNNRPPLFQAANHTAGMKHACGEFIKILHDDDYFLKPDALEKMVKLLEDNPDCDFGYANNIQVDLISNKIIRKRHSEKYVEYARKDPLNLALRNSIGAPSVTIFRNYNDIFFDGNLKIEIDTDFYISYLSKHPKIAFCKEYLIAIGENPEQDTHKVANDKDLIVRELTYLYKKHEKLISKSKLKNNIEKHIKKEFRKLNISKEDIKRILNDVKKAEMVG